MHPLLRFRFGGKRIYPQLQLKVPGRILKKAWVSRLCLLKKKTAGPNCHCGAWILSW